MTSTVCETLTVHEAAVRLRISYRTALKLIKTKELRARWLGNKYLVPLSALEEFLAGSDAG